MKIIFLGYCSNSFSSINTVSFVINHENRNILCDCGVSVTNNLHQYFTNFSLITDIFISHSHFDHFLGLPYFIIGRHLDTIALRKKDPNFVPTKLNIYLPKGLEKIVRILLEKCHSDIKEYSFPFSFYTINEGSRFSINNTLIIPFEVDHTVKTFGFNLLDNSNKILSYSSDTLYTDSIVSNFAGSNYLILEGMVSSEESAFSQKAKHATFSQALSVVEQIKPKSTFLVHLQPRYLEKKEEIINQLQCISQLPISFPEVGKWYELCI